MYPIIINDDNRRDAWEDDSNIVDESILDNNVLDKVVEQAPLELPVES